MQFGKTTRRTLWGLAAIPWFGSRLAASERQLPRAAAGSQIWNRTELYFGSNKPDGTSVSQADFMAFVDAQVTPRFPDGLTLLTGYGQFKGSSGMVIHENSHLLILFYPPAMTDANSKIEQIRQLYNTMFMQESVLRADGFNYISF